VKSCYGIRSTEGTIVEVPASCFLIHELEARASVAFDFTNPRAIVQTVNVVMPPAIGLTSHWWFRRLREVHRESVYYAPVNVTVWWGEQNANTNDGRVYL
jgi:hypothetical protein